MCFPVAIVVVLPVATFRSVSGPRCDVDQRLPVGRPACSTGVVDDPPRAVGRRNASQIERVLRARPLPAVLRAGAEPRPEVRGHQAVRRDGGVLRGLDVHGQAEVPLDRPGLGVDLNEVGGRRDHDRLAVPRPGRPPRGRRLRQLSLARARRGHDEEAPAVLERPQERDLLAVARPDGVDVAGSRREPAQARAVGVHPEDPRAEPRERDPLSVGREVRLDRRLRACRDLTEPGAVHTHAHQLQRPWPAVRMRGEDDPALSRRSTRRGVPDRSRHSPSARTDATGSAGGSRASPEAISRGAALSRNGSRCGSRPGPPSARSRG